MMLVHDFCRADADEAVAADRRAETMIPIMGRHLAGDPVDLSSEDACRSSLLTAYAKADVEAFLSAAIAEARFVRGRAL